MTSFFVPRKMLLLLLVCTLGGRQVIRAQSASADLYRQTSEVNNLMVEYDADHGSLQRFYFISNAPERRERFKKLVLDYRTRLQQLPFEQLNTGARVDYILFNRNLQEEQRKLETEEKEYNESAPWVPFAERIYAIERPRRRGTVPDAEKLSLEMTALYKDVLQTKTKLQQGKSLPYQPGLRAEGTVKGLQAALKSVFDFYNGYDPLFTWWIPMPYKKLDSALAVYATLLHAKALAGSPQKEDGSGIIGNPIGRDEIVRQLQVEMIPYTPEELMDLANKEFAWCDREMLKASHEMGFGDNWKAALEKVKNTYVPPSEQPAAMVKLYNESVDFLKQHDLVTIPPLAEETWRMNMMSPQRQLVSPFFLGGEELLVSYPTDTMDEDDRLMSMRGNNPHFSRATIQHELIAGHHLQLFMSDRYKAYRHFETPFFVEGWALYWEMILWDMKFPQSPEDRVGMLFWRMHRCARILFSLNYHMGKWTPQQCIDFLVDRVGHERANAEGEVRRSFTGGYGPLYQVAYLVGGLQFYALKKELVDSGKMSYKQYHDAVLRENMMPVEMMRAILTNQPLSKDFNTSWRFYKLDK
ncbi:MAG TPA: DUF885 family protein [Chitinophagaceae bacterium]